MQESYASLKAAEAAYSYCPSYGRDKSDAQCSLIRDFGIYHVPVLLLHPRHPASAINMKTPTIGKSSVDNGLRRCTAQPNACGNTAYKEKAFYPAMQFRH
ncbi:unnamed protein product [Periconia digitata]|uniref:Uncharacterized protein n=1 Tax=Periconia digitata TaxID=1303443 RepID=A0A9W4XE86_9PLEO|nr:unnamed protein product [Periconia digitata]